MNTNEMIEAAGNCAIGERRTRTTKTGRVETDNDVSVLPRVKRYRIDAGRSGVAKGEWKTNYMVFLKLDDGDNHAWRHAANVATEYGMSMPATYATFEKAKEAARKMVDTWGHEKAAKSTKAKEPTKAELAEMSDAELIAWAKARREAKAAA